jgi:hypothetical protein
MFDVKAQTQLADATAEMMRACAFAATRAASLSAFQGVSLWSRMLQFSASPWSVQPRFPWPGFDGWTTAWSNACRGTIPQAQGRPAVAAVEQPVVESTVASYRSSGGHAVAQVILG